MTAAQAIEMADAISKAFKPILDADEQYKARDARIDALAKAIARSCPEYVETYGGGGSSQSSGYTTCKGSVSVDPVGVAELAGLPCFDQSDFDSAVESYLAGKARNRLGSLDELIVDGAGCEVVEGRLWVSYEFEASREVAA